MKCYKCAEEGKKSDAVGICIVCGMGLCKEHAIITEVSFWEVDLLQGINPSALGMENKTELKVPRILCDYCYSTLASKTYVGLPQQV